MNDKTSNFYELTSLLVNMSDEGLADEEAERLRDLLRDNPEAQDLYHEYMALHAQLHMDLSNDGAPLVIPVVSIRSGKTTERASRWKWVLAISIMLALIVNAALLMRMPSTPIAEPPDESRPTLDVDAIAVLTQAVDVDWQSDESPFDVDTTLRPCHLRFDRGLVQVEFFSGATVVIEGPAHFELISKTRAFCHHGRLRATVLPHARGFTIGTPGVDVVDLGTEFAMQIGTDGVGEVHVLDGEVELHGTAGATVIDKIKSVRAGRGVRFGPNVLGDIDMIDVDKFIGGATLSQLAGVQSERSFQRWTEHSEKLRSDPSSELYYSFEDHDPWQRRLKNDGPKKDKGRDGAIIGCVWTAGRWPGKGALEFKRTSDRVRIDVPGEFESLTFVAWVRIEGFDQWLSSLMLTDGWDTGEPHWQLSDDGKFNFGVRDGGNHFSPAVLGPSDLGRWVHLATVRDGTSGMVTHFVDGRSVSAIEIKSPIPLRIGPAEIGNWNPQDRPLPHIRSLNGLMDEFGVFSRPFSAREVHEMYIAGRPNG